MVVQLGLMHVGHDYGTGKGEGDPRVSPGATRASRRKPQRVGRLTTKLVCVYLVQMLVKEITVRQVS